MDPVRNCLASRALDRTHAPAGREDCPVRGHADTDHALPKPDKPIPLILPCSSETFDSREVKRGHPLREGVYLPLARVLHMSARIVQRSTVGALDISCRWPSLYGIVSNMYPLATRGCSTSHERGLATTPDLLRGVDGAKGLRKATSVAFGARKPVHRASGTSPNCPPDADVGCDPSPSI